MVLLAGGELRVPPVSSASVASIASVAAHASTTSTVASRGAVLLNQLG